MDHLGSALSVHVEATINSAHVFLLALHFLFRFASVI